MDQHATLHIFNAREIECLNWKTLIREQDDADVFKLYSQAKLGMMREALAKLDRKANERVGNLFTERAS